MHCHAGCDNQRILSAVGLTERDLFNNENKKPVVVAEYIYRNEQGKPEFKVVRFEPKNFVQARYNNGNWEFKMAGVNYVPYNLPNVIKNDEIYFVEGEKDADNLNRLGLVATTTAGGAASFKKKSEIYAPHFKGKTVYIIPDNDKPGYKYAEDIKTALITVAKNVKILKLSSKVENLPEKADISDVIQKYGKDKALEILESLKKDEILEIETDLTKENVFSPALFEKLYEYEISDFDKFIELYGKIQTFCNTKRITGFNKLYKLFKEAKKDTSDARPNGMVFPDLDKGIYKTNRYEISQEGYIFEIIPDVGDLLISYQPIVPLEKFINIEDNSEKIKIGYYTGDKWKSLIVDKSIVSSSQSIVKLSDAGVAVTSENAKHLIKYLSEIENLNKDKIPENLSVSRLGWFEDNTLIPYSGKFQFDNEREMPNIKEKFGEKGELEDWIEFFRERRKFNKISRIVMASGVASILLSKLKQSGFTLHIFGESEFGKTVVCMVGQSMFGNPTQDSDKGIGINFNFTNAGLEYKLNTYNHLPLFVNEMQHQKDAKDYDKLLFLVSEGKGRTRGTKTGGNLRTTSWNNVVITNGEKNIIKDNSNAGAYNRCVACEINKYSFENLPEVADFVKENYGTPIRKILEKLDDFDLKAIYKKSLESLKDKDTSNKQKILRALILTADKIIVDTLFKDDYYLTSQDFDDSTIKSKNIVIEERAYEFVRDWYVSEKRHFLSAYSEREPYDSQELKVEVYGRTFDDGTVAFIPSILKRKLNENGFDGNEIISAWNRKGYLKHEKNRNTTNIRINSETTRCVVLILNRDEEEELDEEIPDEMPF